jgi:hypothetical protein
MKRRGDEPSRSGFIRDQLRENAKLSLKEIIEAWRAQGNTGTITPTLFYQVRSKLGLARGVRRRRRRQAPVAAEAAARPQPDKSDYLSIEATLDHLVAQAVAMKDNRLAEALRGARRAASARLL